MKNQRKLKRACYEDWKLGIIEESDYYEYNRSYSNKLAKLDEQILYLKEELMECEAVKTNNDWIDNLKSIKI